jgi:hypothetical protein
MHETEKHGKLKTKKHLKAITNIRCLTNEMIENGLHVLLK